MLFANGNPLIDFAMAVILFAIGFMCGRLARKVTQSTSEPSIEFDQPPTESERADYWKRGEDPPEIEIENETR